MEKRTKGKRVKKRITLRFGEDSAEKLAFTEDISPHGIFIKTAQVIQPGKVIKVMLELDQGVVHLEGQVAWAKKVPVNMLRLVNKCGMGIRITGFLQGEGAYLAMFA